MQPDKARLCRAHCMIKSKLVIETSDFVLLFPAHNSEAAIGDLVGRLSSSDPNKLLESIKSLESLYSQKYVSGDCAEIDWEDPHNPMKWSRQLFGLRELMLKMLNVSRSSSHDVHRLPDGFEIAFQLTRPSNR